MSTPVATQRGGRGGTGPGKAETPSGSGVRVYVYTAALVVLAGGFATAVLHPGAGEPYKTLAGWVVGLAAVLVGGNAAQTFMSKGK